MVRYNKDYEAEDVILALQRGQAKSSVTQAPPEQQEQIPLSCYLPMI